MSDLAFALDFGTSTLQWARIDVKAGARPLLARQDSMPNVLQVRDGELVAIGEDAAKATFAHLAQTYASYKMYLNGDGGEPWGRDVSPARLTELALQWLVKDPCGLPAMGYTVQHPLVIGAPGHWAADGRGRGSVAEAAKKAGARTLHFIHEPYAALMWWLADTGDADELAGDQFQLIFDFGGGTLDIALLAGSEGKDQLRHGAHVLGGEDFDRRLAEHFQDREFAGSRLGLANRLVLRRASRQLKEGLGRQPDAGAAVRKMEVAPRGLDLDMTRDEFDDVCADLIGKAVGSVADTLARNEVDPRRVVRVLLTGGSSQMHWVMRRLAEALPHLSERDFARSAEPQHDVARGGALFAAGYYRTESLGPARKPAAAPTDQAVEELVLKYALGTGAAVMLNPIPFFDVAVGVGLNWKMIVDVAAKYGRSFGEHEAQALGQEILKCFAGMGVVYVISAFLKITIVGAVLQGAVAGYFTFMTGLAAREYFKRGASWGSEGAEAVLGRLKEEHPPIATIRRIMKALKQERRR